MTLLLVSFFSLGYVLITLEDVIGLNKTATALLTGVICWTVYALGTDTPARIGPQLSHTFGGIAEILFFLLGALTIVELIDAHDGFSLITDRIASRNTRTLLWVVGGLSFGLSALLDNLTTAIVMVTVIRKLVRQPIQRRVMAGLTVVACNAGGAFSPIGDVTTTMLWIGGQVTASGVLSRVLLPSVVSLLVPLVILTYRFRPTDSAFVPDDAEAGAARPYVNRLARRDRRLMLAVGLGGMLFVPIFKSLTQLPPYLGMLLVLGVIWVLSEILHRGRAAAEREQFSAAQALSRIDAPSVLFFLGILLAVGALEATGLLHTLAGSLNRIGNTALIVGLIGLASAVVDNVPIVAATMGMYNLSAFPTDDPLWAFLAYCAGTGGSLLVIGSAAGVAVMGQERLNFGWYLRNISGPALLGYLAGAVVYLLTA